MGTLIKHDRRKFWEIPDGSKTFLNKIVFVSPIGEECNSSYIHLHNFSWHRWMNEWRTYTPNIYSR